MSDSSRYSPLSLIGVIVVVMLGFAAFFISFLVAPLAILALFYFILAAGERSKSGRGRGGGDDGPLIGAAALLDKEAKAREKEIEREAGGIPVQEALNRAGVGRETEDGGTDQTPTRAPKP